MRDAFTEAGYFVVRAASSKGIADLVAARPGPRLWLIQCKTNGVLSSSEWNKLFDTATGLVAVPIFARKDTKGHVEIFRLLAHKVPRARTQPMEPFNP